MPIKERGQMITQTIDLTAEEGNTIVLIGIARRLCKILELDPKPITQEMVSADYGNALYVFNRDFGQFFDIILPEGMTVEQLNASYNRATMTEEKLKTVYLK